MSSNNIISTNSTSSDIVDKKLYSYNNKIKENELLINKLKNIIDQKNTTCAYYENNFKIISNNYKKFKNSKEKLHNAINIMKKNLLYYEEKINKLETMNLNKRKKITILKANIKSQDTRILNLIEEIKRLQDEVNILNSKLRSSNLKVKDI
ncbi:hypothetical protein Z968_06480 [Clostridium novyi A str. 4552]|uniref:Uncharacterized protein n=1 Tax=Clostridium novyi A str. 4552 TaxID=1444289 RepID=A0A0A0I6G5_CLONO|nr:hypothetical protein [Clostridium novyi]KGM96447.1 hypothetical protein Z968_06480 [Clostridium novyi A str. 4552]